MMSSGTTRLFALAATVALLAGVPSSTAAQGISGWGNSAAQNGRYRGAYEQGFREGMQQGERDARAGRSPDLQRHGAYRSADDGYSRRDGDRGAYQRSFRDGFAEGYRASFQRGRVADDRRRPGGFGRSSRGFQDVASARGY